MADTKNTTERIDHDDGRNQHRPLGPGFDWKTWAAFTAVLVIICVGLTITGHAAGATEVDCRPVIVGPYANYDGTVAVDATVPDGCPPLAVRLVVFSLPAGVAALTVESLDAPQTVAAIVDGTLTAGQVTTLEPGPVQGCGELQADVVPNEGEWLGLAVGDVARPGIPGAWATTAERVECTFAPTSSTTANLPAVVEAAAAQASPVTDVSSSGGQQDAGPPPVPSLSPAAASKPSLPDTGRGTVTALVAGLAALFLGVMFLGLGHTMRWGKRS